ncbi:MAG: hypothetical protein ABH852_04210 [Methanobacteriota archaeon]
MENRGTSAGFLLCKLGLAFAAVAFIGLALSMYSSSTRFADREDLEMIASAVVSAIEKIEVFPGESELRRELPASAQHYEILIIGEMKDGLQIIQVCVASAAKVERSLIMSTTVNGGDFRLSMENPHEIVVGKSGTISVELG